MWTVQIRDQTACFVQSDLDPHCPLKLLVSSKVGIELTIKTNLYTQTEKRSFSTHLRPKGNSLLKALSEKEKMLGTSFFFFLRQVFYTFSISHHYCS